MTEVHSPSIGLVLLLHPDDNIVIAANNLAAGTSVEIDGKATMLSGSVELGHKLARKPLAAGDRIFRYGAPIGTMNAGAQPGDHVHSHNLDSDYIPAHGRETIQSRKSGQ